MRVVISLAFIVGTLMFASCEKCATCTTLDTDPLSTDSILTSEFCESGHVYDNQLETYQRTGWDCTEQ